MRISQRQRNNKAVKSEWSISEKVGVPGKSAGQKWSIKSGSFQTVHLLLLWSVRTSLGPSTFILVNFHSPISFHPRKMWRASLRCNNVLAIYFVSWIHFKLYHDKTWLNLKLPWNYLFGRHQFTPGNFFKQLSFRNSDFSILFEWPYDEFLKNVFVFEIRNLCLMSHTVYDLACY